MKITDLKPGMLIKHVGLILKVDVTSDSKFWKGPNINFIPHEDRYHGSCSRGVKEDEVFEILAMPPNVEYFKILNMLVLDLSENRLHIDENILEVKKYMHEQYDEQEAEADAETKPGS